MDQELKTYLDDMRHQVVSEICVHVEQLNHETRAHAEQLNYETREHAEELNHTTRILLEDLRDQVQVVAEGVSALNEKVDRIAAEQDKKLMHYDKRITRLERRRS